MLYDVSHVSAWEPSIVHDVGHVSWVEAVLNRSCTISHYGRIGSRP